MRHPSQSRIGAVARRRQFAAPGLPLWCMLCLLVAWPPLAGGADPTLELGSDLALQVKAAPNAVLTAIETAGAVIFRTTGSVYDAYAWHVTPEEALPLFFPVILDQQNGERAAFCFYEQAFTVAWGCGTVTIDGEGLPQVQMAIAVEHIDRNGPIPPPPPPPVEKLCVLLIYESDDVDDQYPWLANVRVSQKIIGYKPDVVNWEPTDKDEKDEDSLPSANAKLWIKHSEGQGWKLPHLLLIDQDGNLVHHVDCPQGVDATLEVIRKYVP